MVPHKTIDSAEITEYCIKLNNCFMAGDWDGVIKYATLLREREATKQDVHGSITKLLSGAYKKTKSKVKVTERWKDVASRRDKSITGDDK